MANFCKTIEKISNATLLLDEERCRANIRLMVQRAEVAGVLFRPHFKTHQSGLVGEWFRDEGVSCISVSSLRMAAYFAEYGWDDITIAFPVNIRELDAIKKLTMRIRLNLLVESQEVVNQLDREGIESGIFIKIDIGAGRTGIPVGQHDEICRLAETINKTQTLKLQGLLAHGGNTYWAKGAEAIRKIAADAALSMDMARKRIGNELLILSWGDTPSCSMMNDNPGFDEWRPGNFVFYDVMQYHIGSCMLSDIAVALACPVVAVHHSRRQAVIHGGAVHLSKDCIRAENDFELFGYVVEFTDSGWGSPVPGAWLGSVSQEHGIVNLPEDMCLRLKPGQLIGILPVHSCLTVDAMKEMTTLNGYPVHCLK